MILIKTSDSENKLNDLFKQIEKKMKISPNSELLKNLVKKMEVDDNDDITKVDDKLNKKEEMVEKLKSCTESEHKLDGLTNCVTLPEEKKQISSNVADRVRLLKDFKKSAFISESLDDFLSNEPSVSPIKNIVISDISNEKSVFGTESIPKTLSSSKVNVNESAAVTISTMTTSESVNKNKIIDPIFNEYGIKPKTVAEKRRLLEQHAKIVKKRKLELELKEEAKERKFNQYLDNFLKFDNLKKKFKQKRNLRSSTVDKDCNNKSDRTLRSDVSSKHGGDDNNDEPSRILRSRMHDKNDVDKDNNEIEKRKVTSSVSKFSNNICTFNRNSPFNRSRQVYYQKLLKLRHNINGNVFRFKRKNNAQIIRKHLIKNNLNIKTLKVKHSIQFKNEQLNQLKKNIYTVPLVKRLTFDNSSQIKEDEIINSNLSKTNICMILYIGLGRPLYEEQYNNLQSVKKHDTVIDENWARFSACALVNKNDPAKIKPVIVPVVCQNLISFMIESERMISLHKEHYTSTNSKNYNSVDLSKGKDSAVICNNSFKSIENCNDHEQEGINSVLNGKEESSITNKDIQLKLNFNKDSVSRLSDDTKLHNDCKKTLDTLSSEIVKTSTSITKMKTPNIINLKKVKRSNLDSNQDSILTASSMDVDSSSVTSVKDDDNLSKSNNENLPSFENNSNRIIKNRKMLNRGKLRRVGLELRRLNADFLEIGDVNNCDGETKDDCNKNADSEVIFNKNISSEKVTSILPCNMSRKLAKVEKEYHQTVMKSNDDIIFLTSYGERSKRVKKLPKKLQDVLILEDSKELDSRQDITNRRLSEYVINKFIRGRGRRRNFNIELEGSDSKDVNNDSRISVEQALESDEKLSDIVPSKIPSPTKTIKTKSCDNIPSNISPVKIGESEIGIKSFEKRLKVLKPNEINSPIKLNNTKLGDGRISSDISNTLLERVKIKEKEAEIKSCEKQLKILYPKQSIKTDISMNNILSDTSSNVIQSEIKSSGNITENSRINIIKPLDIKSLTNFNNIKQSDCCILSDTSSTFQGGDINKDQTNVNLCDKQLKIFGKPRKRSPTKIIKPSDNNISLTKTDETKRSSIFKQRTSNDLKKSNIPVLDLLNKSGEGIAINPVQTEVESPAADTIIPKSPQNIKDKIVLQMSKSILKSSVNNSCSDECDVKVDVDVVHNNENNTKNINRKVIKIMIEKLEVPNNVPIWCMFHKMHNCICLKGRNIALKKTNPVNLSKSLTFKEHEEIVNSSGMSPISDNNSGIHQVLLENSNDFEDNEPVLIPQIENVMSLKPEEFYKDNDSRILNHTINNNDGSNSGDVKKNSESFSLIVPSSSSVFTDCEVNSDNISKLNLYKNFVKNAENSFIKILPPINQQCSFNHGLTNVDNCDKTYSPLKFSLNNSTTNVEYRFYCIYLKYPFTYVKFNGGTKTGVIISYEKLMDIVSESMKDKKCLHRRLQKYNNNDSCSWNISFGIYAVPPKCIIYFGPYGKNEYHQLQAFHVMRKVVKDEETGKFYRQTISKLMPFVAPEFVKEYEDVQFVQGQWWNVIGGPVNEDGIFSVIRSRQLSLARKSRTSLTVPFNNSNQSLNNNIVNQELPTVSPLSLSPSPGKNINSMYFAAVKNNNPLLLNSLFNGTISPVLLYKLKDEKLDNGDIESYYYFKANNKTNFIKVSNNKIISVSNDSSLVDLLKTNISSTGGSSDLTSDSTKNEKIDCNLSDSTDVTESGLIIKKIQANNNNNVTSNGEICSSSALSPSLLEAKQTNEAPLSDISLIPITSDSLNVCNSVHTSTGTSFARLSPINDPTLLINDTNEISDIVASSDLEISNSTLNNTPVGAVCNKFKNPSKSSLNKKRKKAAVGGNSPTNKIVKSKKRKAKFESILRYKICDCVPTEKISSVKKKAKYLSNLCSKICNCVSINTNETVTGFSCPLVNCVTTDKTQVVTSSTTHCIITSMKQTAASKSNNCILSSMPQVSISDITAPDSIDKNLPSQIIVSNPDIVATTVTTDFIVTNSSQMSISKRNTTDGLVTDCNPQTVDSAITKPNDDITAEMDTTSVTTADSFEISISEVTAPDSIEKNLPSQIIVSNPDIAAMTVTADCIVTNLSQMSISKKNTTDGLVTDCIPQTVDSAITKPNDDVITAEMGTTSVTTADSVVTNLSQKSISRPTGQFVVTSMLLTSDPNITKSDFIIGSVSQTVVSSKTRADNNFNENLSEMKSNKTTDDCIISSVTLTTVSSITTDNIFCTTPKTGISVSTKANRIVTNNPQISVSDVTTNDGLKNNTPQITALNVNSSDCSVTSALQKGKSDLSSDGCTISNKSHKTLTAVTASKMPAEKTNRIDSYKTNIPVTAVKNIIVADCVVTNVLPMTVSSVSESKCIIPQTTVTSKLTTADRNETISSQVAVSKVTSSECTLTSQSQVTAFKTKMVDQIKISIPQTNLPGEKSADVIVTSSSQTAVSVVTSVNCAVLSTLPITISNVIRTDNVNNKPEPVISDVAKSKCVVKVTDTIKPVSGVTVTCTPKNAVSNNSVKIPSNIKLCECILNKLPKTPTFEKLKMISSKRSDGKCFKLCNCILTEKMQQKAVSNVLRVNSSDKTPKITKTLENVSKNFKTNNLVKSIDDSIKILSTYSSVGNSDVTSNKPTLYNPLPTDTFTLNTECFSPISDYGITSDEILETSSDCISLQKNSSSILTADCINSSNDTEKKKTNKTSSELLSADSISHHLLNTGNDELVLNLMRSSVSNSESSLNDLSKSANVNDSSKNISAVDSIFIKMLANDISDILKADSCNLSNISSASESISDTEFNKKSKMIEDNSLPLEGSLCSDISTKLQDKNFLSKVLMIDSFLSKISQTVAAKILQNGSTKTLLRNCNITESNDFSKVLTDSSSDCNSGTSHLLSSESMSSGSSMTKHNESFDNESSTPPSLVSVPSTTSCLTDVSQLLNENKKNNSSACKHKSLKLVGDCDLLPDFLESYGIHFTDD
ncbi:uncharacterized protein LOC142332076 [Lycorma delicatula]|uniref:uncharacterized protein LOC142332076 n=1 Tax=Lycorma delicatula TaxID=130591 RepID=UPI003F518155